MYSLSLEIAPKMPLSISGRHTWGSGRACWQAIMHHTIAQLGNTLVCARSCWQIIMDHTNAQLGETKMSFKCQACRKCWHLGGPLHQVPCHPLSSDCHSEMTVLYHRRVDTGMWYTLLETAYLEASMGKCTGKLSGRLSIFVAWAYKICISFNSPGWAKHEYCMSPIKFLGCWSNTAFWNWVCCISLPVYGNNTVEMTTNGCSYTVTTQMRVHLYKNVESVLWTQKHAIITTEYMCICAWSCQIMSCLTSSSIIYSTLLAEPPWSQRPLFAGLHVYSQYVYLYMHT